MDTKIKYDKSQIDFEAKLTEQAAAGKVLVEVQNHHDGDFLVFADAPVIPPISITERVTTIEARLTVLEKAKV